MSLDPQGSGIFGGNLREEEEIAADTEGAREEEGAVGMSLDRKDPE